MKQKDEKEKLFNPDKYAEWLTGQPKSCNRVATVTRPIVEPLRFVKNKNY